MAPIFYIIVSIKLKNNAYMDINNFTLNWAVGYDDFRHYMNIDKYIIMFVCAILTLVLYINKNKISFLVCSYGIMLFANISFICKLTDSEVYVNEISSNMSNPLRLYNMNIIYTIDKNKFCIASMYVYIGFMLVATFLLIYCIWQSYRSKRLENV